MEEKLTAPEAVRVRFAPSPTGYLHIGSARTALFNWLYARKTRGKFILRIEDTDFSRHMEEAVNLTMEWLKWLGMSWDEGPDTGGNFGPYRQSQRKDIYNQYAQMLVSEKKAYMCFCSPEKLKEKKSFLPESEKKDESRYKYDRSCLYLSKKEIKNLIDTNTPYAIRFLVPEDSKVSFTDKVYGKIDLNSNVIEDFIILRSNGLPTYNFSAAIDDILMEITHVIRGEDHLSNTPKQVLIYNSLGRPLPEFIHLPMILGSDGQKLSKRHGSISIEAFKEEGFLSEAIINFIALLGWSYDEKTTVFSVPELVSRFSLEKINKRPARFDYDKLLWLNGYYIRNLKPEVLENLLREKLEGNVTDKESFKKIFPKIIPLLNERIKTLNEASQFVYPFFNETIHSKKTIFEDLNKADAGYEGEMDNFFTLHLKIIDRVLAILNSLEEFNPAEIEHGLKTIPAELDVNFRKIAEAVRLAVWGFKVSPPLFQTMGILGKEESLRRIKKYREFLSN